MNSLDSNASYPRITLASYYNIFARRKLAFGGVFLLVTVAGVYLTSRVPKTYEVTAMFRVRQPVAPLELDASGAGGPTSNSSLVQQESAEGQVEAIQRPEFVAAVYQAAGIGRSGPDLRVVSEKGRIAVQATGKVPQQLADFLGKLPAVHAEAMDARRRERLRANMELIEEEAEKADRLVLAAERALLPYRGQDPLVAAAARNAAGERSAAEIGTRLREAEIRREVQAGQLAVLRARATREPEHLVQATEGPNPQFVELKRKASVLEAQRQRLLVDFLPTSDEVKAVDQELLEVRSILDTIPPKSKDEVEVPNPKRLALETRITGLETSLEATHVEIDAMKRLSALTGGTPRVLSSGQWETLTARLREEVDTARALRKQLNARLRVMKLTAGSLRPFEIEWIERPYTPVSPVAPQPKKDMVVTLALAALLATAVVFVLEFLDDRTYSPEDVERISPLPSLGAVPLMSPKQSLHIAALPANTPALEAYRLVRSGIGFSGIDTPMRRILVTSPGEGEGKTVTSLNLATAMALDGKRVILIDSDLRRPSLHRILELEASPGLSDVLARTATLESALHQAETPNLRVLCAGSLVPDPAELVGSHSFEALMDQLSGDADVLVFDSPPCLYVADALVLATGMDGAVLVVRTGHTRLSEITAAEAFLRRAQVRILGIVYNQTRSRFWHRYATYGGSGQGHSYEVGAYTGRRNGRNPLSHGTSGSSVAVLPSDN